MEDKKMAAIVAAVASYMQSQQTLISGVHRKTNAWGLHGRREIQRASALLRDRAVPRWAALERALTRHTQQGPGRQR